MLLANVVVVLEPETFVYPVADAPGPPCPTEYVMLVVYPTYIFSAYVIAPELPLFPPLALSVADKLDTNSPLAPPPPPSIIRTAFRYVTPDGITQVPDPLNVVEFTEIIGLENVAPPDPSEVRTDPLSDVPDEIETVAVPDAVDTLAGDVPMTALTYVPAVW